MQAGDEQLSLSYNIIGFTMQQLLPLSPLRLLPGSPEREAVVFFSIRWWFKAPC